MPFGILYDVSLAGTGYLEIVMATCNHPRTDLILSQFWTRISCNYPVLPAWFNWEWTCNHNYRPAIIRYRPDL